MEIGCVPGPIRHVDEQVGRGREGPETTTAIGAGVSVRTCQPKSTTALEAPTDDDVDIDMGQRAAR